jgi:hypothetical protein
MAIEFERRLKKLEEAINPAGPKFFLWDDGERDMRSEAARVRAEPGNENAEIILVGWRGPDETAGSSAGQCDA